MSIPLRLTASCLLLLLSITGFVHAQTKEQSQKANIKQEIQRLVDKKLHYPIDQNKDNSSEKAEKDKNASAKGAGKKGEQVISQDPEPESEVHAAINPQDSSNIIVSPIKRTSNSLTTPVYYTKDYGKTWDKSFFNAVPDEILQNAGGGDPILTFDANGTAYLSWISLGPNTQNELTEGIFWAYSEDGGETWQMTNDNAVGKTTNGSPNFDTFYDKQWMAVDRTNSPNRNNLYVSYTVLNQSSGSREIQVSTKPADSNNFNDPVTVASNLRELQFSDIQVAPNGDVHCIFFAADNIGQNGLYHVRSSDGGKTFSSPQKITDATFPPMRSGSSIITGVKRDRLYPCPHLGIDHSGRSSNGNLYVVWTGRGLTSSQTQNFDIFFTKSTSNGRTWDQAKRVTEGSEDNHKFYPSIAVNDKGYINISWYQQVDGVSTQYFTQFSTDAGENFQHDFPVSLAPTDFNTVGDANDEFGIGEYTKVLTTNSHAIPIWADGRNNNGDLNIISAFVPYDTFESSSAIYRNLSKDFKIEGPFPNPVKEEARIKLELEESQSTQIQLTSIEGKVVKNVANKQYASGNHTIKISFNGLESGQYFLRIQTSKGLMAKPVQVVD